MLVETIQHYLEPVTSYARQHSDATRVSVMAVKELLTDDRLSS